MKHVHGYRKLGRKSSHRKSMLQNLAKSLVTHGRISTTVERAKELRKYVDRLVTLAKKDSLHSRRRIISVLGSNRSLSEVTALKERFADRNGGYTRILKNGWRKGDGAPICFIQFVDYKWTPKEPKPEKETANKAAEASA